MDLLMLALLLSFSLTALHFDGILVHALNIGIQANSGLNVDKDCSRTCESKFCSVIPFLRYGKYCGILYTGCPGEQPCDGLDACCMHHDACIKAKNNDYLSQECNGELQKCINKLRRRKDDQAFPGSTCSFDEVANVITEVMKAAIFAGGFFNISSTN